MMKILSMEYVGKTKVRVRTEEDEVFCVSNRAAVEFSLREGAELSEENMKELYAYLRGKALEKCGRLLGDMGYSRRRLEEKLTADGFPRRIIGEVLKSLEDANYVDDARLAAGYVRYHLSDKSAARIRMDLKRKGIGDAEIEAAFSEYSENEGNSVREMEEEQIRNLLVKKRFDASAADYEERQKMMAFLYRRGYSGDSIRAVLRGQEDF